MKFNENDLKLDTYSICVEPKGVAFSVCVQIRKAARSSSYIIHIHGNGKRHLYSTAKAKRNVFDRKNEIDTAHQKEVKR